MIKLIFGKIASLAGSFKTEIIAALLVALSFMATLYFHEKSVAANSALKDAQAQIKASGNVITTMQEQQKNAANLDQKYTGTIADQQQKISNLQSSLSNGTQWLRISATCNPKVPAATRTRRVVDAASPELTDAAQRDYLTLRRDIVTATNQINYLQDYIRTMRQSLIDNQKESKK